MNTWWSCVNIRVYHEALLLGYLQCPFPVKYQIYMKHLTHTLVSVVNNFFGELNVFLSHVLILRTRNEFLEPNFTSVRCPYSYRDDLDIVKIVLKVLRTIWNKRHILATFRPPKEVFMEQTSFLATFRLPPFPQEI